MDRQIKKFDKIIEKCVELHVRSTQRLARLDVITAELKDCVAKLEKLRAEISELELEGEADSLALKAIQS